MFVPSLPRIPAWGVLANYHRHEEPVPAIAGERICSTCTIIYCTTYDGEQEMGCASEYRRRVLPSE